ncbi:hypothetical protein ACQCRE_16355 [Ralstonia pseudosolanacearum]
MPLKALAAQYRFHDLGSGLCEFNDDAVGRSMASNETADSATPLADSTTSGDSAEAQ